MLRRLHACLGGHVYVPRGLGSSEHLSCHVKFRLADVVSKLSNRYMVRQKLMVHGALPGPRRPRSQSQETPSCIADSSCTIIPHLSIFRRTMMQCGDKFGSSYAFPDPRTENRGLLTVSITSPDKGLHAYGTRDPHG